MNRLAEASSPYLRQHADNPVEWLEWSEHAFDLARRTDRPVFLSVGYSSCHWCHVMAHESFSDEEVARVLNDSFVSVKVDREERPDVDSVYMSAVQALTGRGGWPMSVFLTPDGEPFFGGTYWPRDARHGMPGFLQVLDAIQTAWREQREEVLTSGRRLAQHLAAANELGPGASAVDEGVADRAATGCLAAWDRRLGGFGAAPKFPQAMTIDFLLAHGVRTGDAESTEAALHSLDAMARGGIYDHVGGGFARYATDERWLVPHFEKMLYDNALLLRAYVHAAQVADGRSPAAARRMQRVAQETADYLLRDMRHPGGGLYSATDADSEGVEGRFFTWSAEEFDEVVAGAGEDPAFFRRFYGVTPEGNFSDPHHPDLPATTVLHQAGERDESDDALSARIDRVRASLAERREQRVHPGLDDKILTSWNGLALGALAEMGAVTGEVTYFTAAQDCARFLQAELVAADGRLLHTWREGSGASIPAFLEDVTFLAQGLLSLYEADGDPAWLQWAHELADDAEARFAEVDEDGPTGAYFSTAADAEALVTRPKDLWDNATPAGSSVLVDVNLRLGALLGDPALLERAELTLARFAPRAEQAPTGYGELLRGLERFLGGPLEVAVIGAPDDAGTQALLTEYRRRWRPAAVVAVGPPGTSEPPLLEGRELLDGRPAAYVCRSFACERPVAEPAELADLLG